MPNYNDDTVNIPLPTTPFVFPEPSNFYEAGAEREMALREFIFICRYFKGNSDFPHKELYDDLLKYLIYTEKDFSSSGSMDNFYTSTNTAIPTPSGSGSQTKETVLPVLKFPLKLDQCKFPPNTIGKVAEACAIFGMFYLCRQLGFSTVYDRAQFDQWFDNTPATPATSYIGQLFQYGSTSTRRTMANDPYSGKPAIYKALYSRIIFDPNTGEGFIEPSGINRTSEQMSLNYLFDIANEFGLYLPYNDIDTLLTSSSNPSNYFDLGSKSGPNSPQQLTLLAYYYSLMYRNNTQGSPGGRRYTFKGTMPSDRAEQRKTIIAKIHDIFKNVIFKTGQEAINYETICLYKELYPTAKSPSCAFVATGDGSNTDGLFKVNDLGVLFFSYDLIEDGGEKLARIKSQKSISLKRVGNSIAHIKTFGAQGSASYEDTIITFKNSSTLESYNFNIDASTVTLTGANNVTIDPDPLDSNQKLITKPVTPFISGGPSKTTIGRWNNVTKDLEFFDSNDFTFTLRQVSGLDKAHHEDFDEVQSLICVVPDPSPFPIFISADDLYRNDKFEMPEARVKTLFTSVKDQEGVKEMFRLLKDGGATIQITHLYGNFVGKCVPIIVPDRTKIIPDPSYIPHTSTTLKEDGIQPEPALYDLLRYSFAIIDVDYTICSAPKITIAIDSYVSPRFSDLKGRMINTDPNGFNYDYRNDTIPVGSGLPTTSPPDGNNLETNYTNGYLINNPPNVPAGIKSFNQPLAMLRSFGLLEGIFYRLKKMAQTQYASDISAYNTIYNKLQSKLVSAVAVDRTAESRGLTTSSTPTIASVNIANTIDFNQYQAFKWYALKAILRSGPLGPAGPGDATTIPPTPYIVNGQQVYEYFQYLHETW